MSRRRFLLTASLGVPVFLAACNAQSDRASDQGSSPDGQSPSSTPTSGSAGQTLPPTPSCVDADDAAETPEQTEGPFFTPSSPEKTNFRGDVSGGTPLLLTGTVLSTACTPIAGALLDFWQADDEGNYDNAGFKLRGHFFAADDGTYRLETIVPGLYPGRTRHLHVKVQAPGGAILTTQLYLPDEPANARDSIYQPELEVTSTGTGNDENATFDFVLAG